MTQDQLPKSIGALALVALGSNVRSRIGTPLETVIWALDKLRIAFGSIKVSQLYTTPAFPAGNGPDFVNAVIRFETSLAPQDILTTLHDIEHSADRERETRWGQRTLDLDLLAVNGRILPDEKTLNDWINLDLVVQQNQAPSEIILPHPRIQDRSFVLVPMADVAKDWCHPTLGLTVAEMLSQRPQDERDCVVAI